MHSPMTERPGIDRDAPTQFGPITSRSGLRTSGEDVLCDHSIDLPQEFGDYQLLEELGRGGMGVVFRAYQPHLKRDVALKMLLEGSFATPEQVARFQTEAAAAAELQHPGIVSIHDVGKHGSQNYYAMAFIQGERLDHLIRQGPLLPKRAAEIGAKLADAVQYAHERGTIHRDIKPANIILEQTADQPKLMDFGIAKVRDDSNKTQCGSILGTPGFIPPEQAAGSVDKIDDRSDIYALGAVIYFLVTGRPPFQTDNAIDTLLQVLERTPVSVRELNPKVPRDLETIVHKCLAKDPKLRYQSARALADDLNNFVQGLPIAARPPGPFRKLYHWSRKYPAAILLIVLTPLVPLIGARIRDDFTDAVRRENNTFVRIYTNARRSGTTGNARDAPNELLTVRAVNELAEVTAYLAPVLEAIDSETVPQSLEELSDDLRVSHLQAREVLMEIAILQHHQSPTDDVLAQQALDRIRVVTQLYEQQGDTTKAELAKDRANMVFAATGRTVNIDTWEFEER